jgi:hypothetical protein
MTNRERRMVSVAITEEILKKVRAYETDFENFQRCLRVSICPKCGGSLNKEPTDDLHFIDFKYTCQNCNFNHTSRGE